MPKVMPQGLLDVMGAFMTIKWLIPLIALAEIIGSILVITNKYRALGAIIIFPVMVGVLLTHIVNDPSALTIALVLFIINLWIIYDNRAKYMPMIR